VNAGFAENWTTQARKGVLELAVLNALRGDRLYGYEIVKRLKRVPGLVISEGTIYPIMSRLQRERLVESSLEPSPEGPARKYYRLTPGGESTLEGMNAIWDAMTDGVEELQGDDAAD
jgi:PadR family transcriptional regulator PadR